MKQTCLLLVFLVLSGCFRFGDDVELSGVNFTSGHLKKITELTGVRFPEGSIGIEYYYLGSGIDPALSAKIEIPRDKKDDFLSNDIFQRGRPERPHIEVGNEKPWWRPAKLTSPINRTMMLPNAQFLECSVGDEDGKLIVYLTWITT